MKALSKSAAMFIGMLIFSSTSFAAGFRLPDQDAAAMGLAGAFVGQADNPSAVWYNPAGITQLDGTRISGGAIAIYPVMKHDNADGTTDVSGRKIHLPFQLFATSRINDKIFFGLGVTNPFGLSTDWADTSSTKYVATFSEIKTLNINPNIAYKAGSALSVAAGINYLRLNAAMDKLLPFPGDPDFHMTGDGDGWGANLGVKYKASDKMDVGFSYRSKIKVHLEGTAEVDIPGIADISNAARTDITLPALMQLGISYKATGNLTLNADLDYTGWSSYDRLAIKSDSIYQLGAIIKSLNPASPNPTDTSIDEKQWKNTYTLRVGGQYKLSGKWKLRAGYAYDQSPVPQRYFDTRVPDSDRQAVMLGTGCTIGNITVDAAYMYLRFNNRTVTDSLADDSTPAPTALNGTYKSVAHLVGITIGYKF